jgi:hypothetical protein
MKELHEQNIEIDRTKLKADLVQYTAEGQTAHPQHRIKENTLCHKSHP